MSLVALDGRALVLNRSWAAISTTPVRNALRLMVQDVARAVCTETYTPHDFASWAELSEAGQLAVDDDEFVHTVSLRIRV
ncbi:MAG: hypothetical protein ACYTG4_03470, partial [Planctomycetota bacterium]